MSTEQTNPIRNFVIEFSPALDSAFDIETPQTPVSNATVLAVIVQGECDPNHPRYLEEFNGYYFGYTRDEESQAFPINRLAVYDFIEQVLTHINCDAVSVDEYGEFWLEHCWYEYADCVEVDGVLYVYPRWTE